MNSHFVKQKEFKIPFASQNDYSSLPFLEPVPKYYILPPDLFVADVNFGEIEFPVCFSILVLTFQIYFNFFMKKAFLNPDNKIVIIGESQHLERVKTVFKESFHGPDPKCMYVDEELSPARKVRSGFLFIS